MIDEKLEVDPFHQSLLTIHIRNIRCRFPKVIAGVVFNGAFHALLLFAPVGTLHWRTWVFLAVTVAVMALAIVSILPDNADLFSQRANGIIQKAQPSWDRVLVILLVVSYVGQIVLIPLDVFRFHFVPKPSGIVELFGLALYVAGWWIMNSCDESQSLCRASR